MNSLHAKKEKDKKTISYFLSIIKNLKSSPITISSESETKNAINQSAIPLKKNILVLDPYETYISLIDKKLGLILKNLPYLLIMLDTNQVYRIYFINKYLTDNPMSDFSEIFKLDMDGQDLDDKLFYYVGNFSNMIPIILINFKIYLKRCMPDIGLHESKSVKDDIQIVKYSYRMNGCPVRCLDPKPYVKEIEWL